MIGQTKVLENIKRIANGNFPRFSIICGQKHGGKKLIAKEIAKTLNAQLISTDVKVDTIRDIIKLAYKQTEPTVYLLADADKMSLAAKNALLKITEEPPQKAYFIMTITDINNTLQTLRSRGTILNLDPYTPDELLRYADEKGYDLNEAEEHIVTNICTVPGEIDLIVRYNIIEFYKFVETVIKNIGVVNGANAFKIASRFNYKEGDGGWDISLFFKAIMYASRQLMIETPSRELKDTIKVTSKYLSQLNINGVNKSSTVDMWILETRGVWIKEG